MNWYLVQTKPRQEQCALVNLEHQGYECYFPTIRGEKLCSGQISVLDQPLFPRYLFIRLGQGLLDLSWSPIRSTKGVSRLVRFGNTPAKVEDALISSLKAQEAALQLEPRRLFMSGERVRITKNPFAGIEGVYQMSDADQRVMVLIELMSKPIKILLHPSDIQKTG